MAAGTGKGNGYIMLLIDGSKYLAHRLAWLHATGTWPTGQVDHLNGDKRDNRIANLRDVPHQVNSQNVRAARRTSKTGVLGVSWDSEKKRFVAGITVDGKRLPLGRFNTTEAAHAAYIAAKRRHHAGNTL